MNADISIGNVREALKRYADPGQAVILQRFFKTRPGEYGEGDVFIGVKVPQTRSVAKTYRDAPHALIKTLLKSEIHEERLLALLLMVERYSRGDEKMREEVFGTYLKHTRHINNWDLVDLSAPQIVGRHLERGDRSLLKKLGRSESLWERRIAIIATFWFIKKNDFADALQISEILLNDGHDLIHKAVGWMLREIGKRETAVEEEFLKPRDKNMPRTMLRYAIERFPENKCKAYMIKLL